MNDDSGEGGKSRKTIDRLVLDFRFLEKMHVQSLEREKMDLDCEEVRHG
jgi:hypothetical protein